MASDAKIFDQPAADDLRSTSTSTIKLEATGRKRKAEDAWDEDHYDDEDSDEELSGVEEFTELVKELKSKEKEHEAKARQTRDKLRKAIDRGKDITLGDIRGDWTLYSTVYLEKVIGIASENDGLFDNEELDNDWETATLNIDDEDMEVFMPQEKGSLGVELFLEGRRTVSLGDLNM
jgi:hypothetical protein